MKKKIIPWLLTIAMIFTLLPAAAISAFAAETKHSCKDKEDCVVCTVAEKINALPEAKNIDVNNAAAVTEQIHAIDRIKGEMSDDQYEELLTLVESKAPDSGFGMDVPKLYIEAVEAVTSLKAGGSLFVQKSYSTDDVDLNWEKSNAVFSIECVDPETTFEPLKVTLADISTSSLTSFYSAEADGWTNQYILPAGTYKVTEVGYNAVTEDGDKLVTTATYTVNGEDTTECAIVTVEAEKDSFVTVLNAPPAKVQILTVDSETGEALAGAHIQLINSDSEVVDEWDSSEEVHTVGSLSGGDYTIHEESAPEGYYTPIDITFTVDDSGRIETDGSVSEDGAILIKHERTKAQILTVDSETGEALAGAHIQIINGNNEVVEEWWSTKKTYEIEGLVQGEQYTLNMEESPEGYYYVNGEDSVYFEIDSDGVLTANYCEISDEGVLLVELCKIDQYYIPLLPKTFTYGDAFGGNIVDKENATCNGEAFDTTHIGQAFYVVCEDSKGNKYDTQGGALIPVGTYTMTGKAYQTENADFDFGEPVAVTVTARTLTSDDIESVEVEEKTYDGTVTAEVTVTFKQEGSKVGYTGGLQIIGYNQQTGELIYDELTAVVIANFEDASVGDGKTVNYTITSLSGDAAGNYTLPEGGITGTTTASITGTVPENPDEENGNTTGGNGNEDGNAGTGSGEGNASDNNAADKEKDAATDTSDNMDILLWLMIMTAAAAAGVAVVTRKLRA